MKKFTKIALLFSMVVIMVVAFAACNKDNPDNGKVDLSWNSLPRLTYVIGQDLDTSIGQLTVNKNGSSTKVNLNDPNVQITGYNKNQLGAQTLTVTYQGATITYNVTVNNRISLNNVEVNYIAGETFKRTGKVTVTTDGGEVKECDLADSSKISLSNVDTKTPGTNKAVTITYNEGMYNYTDTFEINVFAVVGDPVVQGPTNNKAWSHDTTIDLDGRVTFNTTNSSFSRTVEMKDMTLVSDVASLFKAATSANTESSPLPVDVVLKYLDYEAHITINVAYSPVSAFVEKFDNNLSGLSVAQRVDEAGNKIDNAFYVKFSDDTTKAANEKKILEELWTDYNNLENSFKAALSRTMGTFSGNENSYLQRYVMLASLYFFEEYNNLLSEYINTDEEPAIFAVDPSTLGLGAEAPTYEVTKRDYDKMMTQLDEVADAGTDTNGVKKFKVTPKSGTNMEKLFKYSTILNTIKTDGILGNLNFGNTEVPFKTFLGTDYGYYVESFSDFLNGFGAYDGHGTLEMLKNMLQIYDDMNGITSANANEDANKTKIEAVFNFITGDTNRYFTDLMRPQGENYNSQYRPVYKLIDEWRETAYEKENKEFKAEDGILYIIYKHYYDKDVSGQTTANWTNIDKLAHVCFPGEIEEYYNFLSGAAFDFYYTVYLQRFGMHHMGNAYYDYYSAVELNKKLTEGDNANNALIQRLITQIKLDFGYFGQIQGNSQYNTLDYILDFLEPNVIAQFQLNVYQDTEYDKILNAYLTVLKDYENSTCFDTTDTNSDTIKFTQDYEKNFKAFIDAFTGASPELQLQFLLSFCNYDELLLDYDSASSMGQQFIETITLVFNEYYAVELTFDAPEDTLSATNIYNYFIKAYEMFLRRDVSSVYDSKQALYNYNAGASALKTANDTVKSKIKEVLEPFLSQLQIFADYCDGSGNFVVTEAEDPLFENFENTLSDLEKLFAILNEQNNSRLVKLSVLSAYENLEYIRKDIEAEIIERAADAKRLYDSIDENDEEGKEITMQLIDELYSFEDTYRYAKVVNLPSLGLKNATYEATFYGIRGLVVNMLLTVWPSFNGNDKVVGAVSYFDNEEVRKFLLDARKILVPYGLNIKNYSSNYDAYYGIVDDIQRTDVNKILEDFHSLDLDARAYIYSLDAENNIKSLTKAFSVYYTRQLLETTFNELDSVVAKYLELEEAYVMYKYAKEHDLEDLEDVKEDFIDAYEIFESNNESGKLTDDQISQGLVSNFANIKTAYNEANGTNAN